MWIQPQHKVRDPIWTVGTRWCKFSDTLCSTRDRTDSNVYDNWRSNTPAGRLLPCEVGWAQYCAGTSDSILENVHSKLFHLESKWLLSLRTYLSKINASVKLDRAGIASTERQHDIQIMDCVMNSNQFTPDESKRLNYCRMYLGALTLSDLATTMGDRLDPAKLTGDSSLCSTQTIWL